MANNLSTRRDGLLKDLVAARRDEVVLLQEKRTKQLEDLEIRGARRLADLKKTLPKGFVAVLDSLDKIHRRSTLTTKPTVEDAKAELAASCHSKENQTEVHPGLAGNCPIVPNTRA
jgi:hypothetical protein